jgi:hypothetical protein
VESCKIIVVDYGEGTLVDATAEPITVDNIVVGSKPADYSDDVKAFPKEKLLTWQQLLDMIPILPANKSLPPAGVSAETPARATPALGKATVADGSSATSFSPAERATGKRQFDQLQGQPTSSPHGARAHGDGGGGATGSSSGTPLSLSRKKRRPSDRDRDRDRDGDKPKLQQGEH